MMVGGIRLTSLVLAPDGMGMAVLSMLMGALEGVVEGRENNHYPGQDSENSKQSEMGAREVGPWVNDCTRTSASRHP